MDHRKPDSDADARLRHAGAIAGFCYEASRLPLSEEEQNDVRALCLFMIGRHLVTSFPIDTSAVIARTQALCVCHHLAGLELAPNS